MNEQEAKVLGFIEAIGRSGHYAANGFDIFIDIDANEKRVTVTRIGGPNYQILFEGEFITYAVAHLSWHYVDSTEGKRKAIDAICGCLMKIHKKANHKPLLQRFAKWVNKEAFK